MREPKNAEQSISANPAPSVPSTTSINCVPSTLDPFIGDKRSVTHLSAPTNGKKKSRLTILAPSSDASPCLSATSTDNNMDEPPLLADKMIKPLIFGTYTYNKKSRIPILDLFTDTKMNEPCMFAPSTATKKNGPTFSTFKKKKKKPPTLAPSNTVKKKDPVILAPSTGSKKCGPIFAISNNNKRQPLILAPSNTVKKRGPVIWDPSTGAKKSEPCLSAPFARGENTQPSRPAPLNSSKMCKRLLQATFIITKNREPQISDQPTRANPIPLGPSISIITSDLPELSLDNFTCHEVLRQGTYGKVSHQTLFKGLYNSLKVQFTKLRHPDKHLYCNPTYT